MDRFLRRAALSPSGEFLGHVGLSPDITDRKASEQALQFQHSLIRAIHEGSLDRILVVNDQGIVVSHNNRLMEVWKIDSTTLPDRPIDNSLGSLGQPFLLACIERVKNPKTFLKRVQELYADPDSQDYSEVALKDGRTLERYSSSLRREKGDYLSHVSSPSYSYHRPYGGRSPDDRDRCLTGGMNDYIFKPVNLSRLRYLLATWLSISRRV